MKHDPEIFDFDDFKERMMNDEELLEIIISGFVEKMPGMLNELKEFIAQGDQPDIKRQAHKIKGASANLGGELLRRAALKIELAAGEGELEALPEMLRVLEKEWEKLRAVLTDSKNGSLNRAN
jgi:HPt (histidine-containing phosphotransfer) domain-containing protein